jgi:3-methyladenine DNA glycosylase/8-oxoguanine DNA glycosylase
VWTAAPAERTLRLPEAVDLRLTLGPLQRGPHDPCLRFDGPGGSAMWRATRTPEGPATTHMVADSQAAEIRVRAWGPGAAWALDAAPALVGAHDRPPRFELRSVVGQLQRRLRGLRIPRSQAVVETLVPVVIEQKVVGLDAHRSYRMLVRAKGEPAPGPSPGLMVPPPAATLAATPSWVMHRWNLERARADTIRRACSSARRLEETLSMAPDAARQRLTVLPGLGSWTAAKVALVALGDADAVPTGDYHLPLTVCWALAGLTRGDDATMLQLLEPYQGQRGLVVRLLAASGIQAPRFGPRMPRHDIRGL